MNSQCNNLKKAAMLEALRHTLGNISEAAAQVGISRKTHYQWLQTDAEYRADVEDNTEAAIDFVEGKLFQLIDGATRTIQTPDGTKTVKDPPNVAATIFYLKTRGRARGYGEQPEMNEPPVQIIISDSI